MDRSRDINFNFDGLIILVVSVQRKIHGRRRNFDSFPSFAGCLRWKRFLQLVLAYSRYALDLFFLFPTTKILLFRIFIGTKKHYPSKVWSANFDENRLTLVGRIIVSKYDLRRIFGSLLIPFNCIIKNVFSFEFWKFFDLWLKILRVL